MELTFKIGQGSQTVNVADQNLMGVLMPNEVSAEQDALALLQQAMEQPVASPRLRELVRPGERIVIVTSDMTRPMPTKTVMPIILDELYRAGVSPEDITLVFARGSHRGHSSEEMRALAGERAWKEISCVDSDRENCLRVGITARGTPVDIDRRVAEADRRICLGNIEYHYFAGYSGGAKAIMPGVSTWEAIRANHRHMTEEGAYAGNLEGNPVREDLEEAAAMVGVDFILNVVLGAHREILYAVAGDVTAAHRQGCRFLDQVYGKKLSARADIVLVSQGGHPKDVNLYQTQKALDNAKHAVKPGGVIVLMGSCKEGLGEKTFQEWLTSAKDPEELVLRIRRDFELGGHKAAAIAMVLQKAQIYLVSDLEGSLVEQLFMRPFATVQDAYDAALEVCGANATVLAMPYGGSTLPKAED